MSILVVDDDRAIRTMLESVLEEEGYNVILAGNGQEALEQAHRMRPAIVLLDLMMPVMNGWQFLEAVNNNPELEDVPILLLSASREVARTANQSSVKAYLSKPFELNKLLDYIKLYAAPE